MDFLEDLYSKNTQNFVAYHQVFPISPSKKSDQLRYS